MKDLIRELFPITALFAGVALLLLALSGGCIALTGDTVQTVVTDKERVLHNGSSSYLIYTEDETFKLKDVLVLGNFSSSDLYGSIKRGGEYQFDVYGWRIPLFSTYRIITDVEAVSR